MLDKVETLAIGEVRPDVVCDIATDVLEPHGHEDARARAGPKFLLARPGEEAVLHEVALGLRVELEGALYTMVIGDDEAVRRNEGRAAAAERDDGAHGEAGQVGEGVGVALKPECFEPVCQGGNLLRHPHSFIGPSRVKRDDSNSENEGAAFHGCLQVKWRTEDSSKVCGPTIPSPLAATAV